MQKQSIKNRLARNGFVFTDLDSGVRVTARGPKSPADPPNDGFRDTVVKAQRNGTILEQSSHRTRGARATEYVRLVEEYG